MDDLHLFDERVVERYIKKGKVTREQYESYLASLPDLAEEAEAVDYDDLLRQEEHSNHLPMPPPGGGTPMFTGGSAAGPLPPLPISGRN